MARGQFTITTSCGRPHRPTSSSASPCRVSSPEWGAAPPTIHVVGGARSGRAYELRQTLERCAMPHTSASADSAQGRDDARAGARRPGRRAPSSSSRTARALEDPTTALAVASGTPLEPGAARSTSRHRRRRATTGLSAAVCTAPRRTRRSSSTAAASAGDGVQLADPQLPGVPARDQRRPASPSRPTSRRGSLGASRLLPGGPALRRRRAAGSPSSSR